MSYLERTGWLTGRVEETTEKQRIIAKFLSNRAYLDWYSVLTIPEIWTLERMEKYYNILKMQKIEAQWLRFVVEKHKRLRVSTEIARGIGSGREGLIRMSRPEVLSYPESTEREEKRKRTLREKLFGR